MSRRLRCAAWLIAAVTWLTFIATAAATYAPPQILSATGDQQFQQAAYPVFAAGGHYVVFQGTLGGQTGIWRRDLATGEVDLVAASGTNSAGQPYLADGPSVSADGRYVAFTSNAVLDPGQEPAGAGGDYTTSAAVPQVGCPEVYVEDMDTGTVTLVSDLNGTTTGITFAGCGASDGISPTGNLLVSGAQAAAGVAISADGSEVAFTVLSTSNLGTAGAVTTPASQVAVRDLAVDTTTIVTVQAPGTSNAGAPVSATATGHGCYSRAVQGEVPCPAGGGAFPSATSEINLGGPPQSDVGGGPAPASTAAISGDGTTVAWLGTNVPSQVPGASDVVPGMLQNEWFRHGAQDPAGQEVEPLWRRIADGPGAVTQRLLTGAGLSFYGFQFDTQSDGGLPIEGGSAEGAVGDGAGAIALSADGQRAVVTADAPAQAGLGLLQQSTPQTPLPNNAYAVSVSDAPGSTPQVTPLTSIDNYPSTPGPADGDVSAVAISPDGDQIAFETARTEFGLASPALITPPTTYTGYASTYVVDLPAQTFQDASSTYDGQPADQSAGWLSVDDAGDVAESSLAGNLFYGDVNPRSVQTYLLAANPVPTAVATGSISAPAAGVVPTPTWTASATARARRDGAVVLRVSVPGAGRLSAQARAQLPAAGPRRSHRHRRSRRVVHHRHPRRGRAGHHRRRPPRTAPAVGRPVAQGHRTCHGPSVVFLRLSVGRRYRALTETTQGLYAIVTVRFSATGHAPVTQTLPVVFRRRARGHRRTRHHRHVVRGRR